MEPVADKNNGHSKRVRGVQASPAKLRSAQLAAGIKSQAELSKRIQQLEGLDKPPRSLVNRVCSGEQVDLLSLERVAKALNTEAWALYLNSDDAQQTEPMSMAEPAPAVSRYSRYPIRFILLLAALLLLVVVFWYLSAGSVKMTTPEPAQAPALKLARKVITVLPFQGEHSQLLTPLLEQALARYSSILPGSAARFASANPLQLLADKSTRWRVWWRICSRLTPNSCAVCGRQHHSHARLHCSVHSAKWVFRIAPTLMRRSSPLIVQHSPSLRGPKPESPLNAARSINTRAPNA